MSITTDAPPTLIPTPLWHRSVLALSCLLTIIASGCAFENDAPPAEELQRAESPVINGTATSSWPAVGALVLEEEWFGVQQFTCSSTLIDEQWVLTAAHCVDIQFDDGYGGSVQLEPYLLSFCVGQDARTSAGCHLYPADSFHIHDDWDPDTVANDIALIHLANAVPSAVATPIAYNARSLSGHSNENLTMVGYGLEDAFDQDSSGIKRYGVTRLQTVSWTWIDFLANASDQLICFGDSGGANLMNLGYGEVLVGVNSTVSSDYCDGTGTSTRVDAYANWIEDIMDGGGGPTSCDITGGDCGSQACYPLEATTFQCFPSDGRTSGQACNSEQTESLPCGDGSICLDWPAADGGEGEVCYEFCQGQEDCSSSDVCVLPIFEGIDDVGVCLYYPTCEITGGSCDDAQACYPTTDGSNHCFESDERAEGATCNSDSRTWDVLPCDDGLICIQTGDTVSAGTCFQFCEGAGDCRTDQECYSPIFTDIEGLGVCTCRDNDDDGYCQDEDCNDGNPAVHPDATEACGNLIDDDCDTYTDEDCGTCTDADHDSYCAETGDCNDGNPAVHPNATETCDNLVDDDCDTYTDEDCGTCTDADSDTYCLQDGDCNDGDPTVHPEAAEVCGNLVDDDCDTYTDEDCPVCTDLDHDGFCAETDDCNDEDFDIRPTMPEACGDLIDNDCDDQTDETCGCEDADNDGYCAVDDCDDTLPEINPGAGEVCDDGVDNNCNGWMDLDDWDYCDDPADPNPQSGGGGGRSGSAVGCFSVAGEGTLRGGTWLCLLATMVWLGWWARPRRRE